MNVRGSPSVVVIAPRILAWPNRDEAIAPFRVGKNVATAGEVRIQRSIMLIDFMQIAARSIGLPNFYKRLRDGPRIFIEHTPAHHNSFAERFARMLPG